MFFLYFIVAAHDICGIVDTIPKSAVIDYIYSLQYVPTEPDNEAQIQKAGFLGGEFLGFLTPKEGTSTKQKENASNPYNHGSVVHTYPAIACLKILGDDLSRLDKKSIIAALKYLQTEDGG